MQLVKMTTPTQSSGTEQWITSSFLRKTLNFSPLSRRYIALITLRVQRQTRAKTEQILRSHKLQRKIVSFKTASIIESPKQAKTGLAISEVNLKSMISEDKTFHLSITLRTRLQRNSLRFSLGLKPAGMPTIQNIRFWIFSISKIELNEFDSSRNRVGNLITVAKNNSPRNVSIVS